MDLEELYEVAERATYAHADRYGDEIAANPADSMPHGGPGGKSDLNEHAYLVSAPPAVDDELNRQLVAALNQWKQDNGIPTAAAPPPAPPNG